MTIDLLKSAGSAAFAATVTYLLLLLITPSATEMAANGGIVDPSFILLMFLGTINGLGFGIAHPVKTELGINMMIAALSAMTVLAGYMTVYLIWFGSAGTVLVHFISLVTGFIIGRIFSAVFERRMQDS